MNVTANKYPSLVEKLHHAVTTWVSEIDSFDVAVIRAAADRMKEADAKILRAQLNLLNSTYREFDNEAKVVTVYFYWKYFGKSRLDYPQKWPEQKKEKLLASVHISYDDRINIKADLWQRCKSPRAPIFCGKIEA
jgi:hypothetical protein